MSALMFFLQCEECNEISYTTEALNNTLYICASADQNNEPSNLESLKLPYEVHLDCRAIVLTYCHYCITKTCLYNFDPLKPHFYIVKLGFTGVYIIFLISAQNIDCWYSLEPPRRGGSNEYQQSMLCAEI